MVSIPRLKRIQPSSSLPQTGRINIKATDQAGLIQQRVGAVSGVVDEVRQIERGYEDSKIDSLTYQGELAGNVWNDSELSRLKDIKGDPTEEYAKYDQASQEKFEEILNKNPDLNERVKRNLATNLGRLQDSQRVQFLKQRGLHQNVYKNDVFVSSKKLKQNELSRVAGSIRKDDDSSFLSYDKVLNDLRSIHIKRGLENGSIEKVPDDAETWTRSFTDHDGKIVKVKMNNNAKLAMSIDVSEGISSSIEVMINGGQVEEATLMMERYEKNLEPKKKVSITKKFKTENDGNESFAVVEELVGKSSESRKKILDKLTPEVRHKVKRLEESNTKLRGIKRERRFKVNHERLDKFVDSANLHSFEALTNTEEYKQMWDKLDRKGRDAIRDKLDSPAEDDPEALSNAQDILTGNHPTLRLEDMDSADWNREMGKLSKGTVRSLTAKYISMATPKASKQVAFSKRARKILEDQLILVRHVKIEFGKVRDQDRGKLIEANNALIDLLHERYEVGEIPNQKEVTDFIKEFAVSAKQRDLENFKPTPRKFQTRAAREKEEDLPPIPRAEKKKFMLDYMKANNGNAPTEVQLNEFIIQNR